MPGIFKTLVADFGSLSKSRDSQAIESRDEQAPAPGTGMPSGSAAPTKAKSAVRLMLEEERETGEVKWAVYTKYLRAMGSWWWAMVIAAALLLEQGATVGNSLLLGFWSDRSITGFAQGQYMAAYAGTYRATHSRLPGASLTLYRSRSGRGSLYCM